MFSANLSKENIIWDLQNVKKFICSDWHFCSILIQIRIRTSIYTRFIWSKSCLVQFSVQKTWIFSSKTQKPSSDPNDISLAYLVYLRLRTPIYTRFTSFGASHVYRNFRYRKREFRPPKRKLIRLLRLTIFSIFSTDKT
jgi:hypothetical protein